MEGARESEDVGWGQLTNGQAEEFILLSDDHISMLAHSSWQQCEKIQEKNQNPEIIMKIMQWSYPRKSLVSVANWLNVKC